MDNKVLDTSLFEQTLSSNGHQLKLKRLSPTEFLITESNVNELPVNTSINTRTTYNDGNIELYDGTTFTIQ